MFCKLFSVDFWFNKDFDEVETACICWLGRRDPGPGQVWAGVGVSEILCTDVVAKLTCWDGGATLPVACLRSLTIAMCQGTAVGMVGSGSILQVIWTRRENK